MTSQPYCVQPPRIANWLINLFAAGEEAESLLGDMLEEFSHLALKSGVGVARSWYWRQTRKTVAHLIGATFREAPWLIAATVIGGFLLNWLVAGLSRPLSAVLFRHQVFDHISMHWFFGIEHVIASFVIGCIVALAAKRREMVATMTLVAVFCAMITVGLLQSLAKGHYSSIQWMLMLRFLPWYFADWFAIVIGGAIVRTRRPTPTRLRSAT
jgi:hypothetical protein